MSQVRIIHTTPSKIVLEYGGRTGTLLGEALVRSPGMPDFILYAGSLKRWDSPFAIEPIPEQLRDAIVTEVVRQLTAQGWVIETEP